MRSKSHAMDGHALALFLVDSLLDTLTDLQNHTNPDPFALLEELRQEENNNFKSLLEANVSAADFPSLYIRDKEEYPAEPFMDLELLWKGPSFCRTARLPAQSRYLGYTTNTPQVGGISVLGNETYDVGTVLDEVDNDPFTLTNQTMLLVYENAEGERKPCEVPLKPDYKDYFYSHNRQGRTKLIIPNDKEREAYKYNDAHFQGVLVLFFVSCDWGRCKKGELRPEHHVEGKFEVSVNGKVATALLSLGSEAWVLQGAGGSLHWEPGHNGSFEVSFLAIEKDGYLRISSIVLY